MIRSIEELSMNAWPAMQTLHYDGWVLRFADGYTKRANSVYPLYPSEINVDEKIDFCESFYRRPGPADRFQIDRRQHPRRFRVPFNRTRLSCGLANQRPDIGSKNWKI